MIACKRWAQGHILCDTSILFVCIKENTALEAVINKQNRKGNRCTLLPRSHNLPYCINYQWCHTIVTDVLKSSQMVLHDPLVIIIAPQQGGQNFIMTIYSIVRHKKLPSWQLLFFSAATMAAWWHVFSLGHFHRAISHLKWHKIVSIWYLACTLVRWNLLKCAGTELSRFN